MDYYELEFAQTVRSHEKASKALSQAPRHKRLGILEMLQERFPGYHPLASLAQLVHAPGVSVEQAIGIHTTLAKYIAPQLKQIDIHAHIENEVIYKPVIHRFNGSMDSDDIEEGEVIEEDKSEVFL